VYQDCVEFSPYAWLQKLRTSSRTILYRLLLLEQALAAVDCKKGENTNVARVRAVDDVWYTDTQYLDVQISTE
jgi:hypothetical protein